MQEFKYVKYDEAVIINLSGEIYEYHRLTTEGGSSGVVESGRVYNQTTQSYIGEVVKLQGYITLTVYPTELEVTGANLESVLQKTLDT